MNNDPIHAFCRAEEEDQGVAGASPSTTTAESSALAPAAPTVPIESASTDVMAPKSSKEVGGVDLPLQRPVWISSVDRAFLVCREVHISSKLCFSLTLFDVYFIFVNMSSSSKLLGKLEIIQVRKTLSKGCAIGS